MTLRPLLVLALLGLAACTGYSGVTKAGDQLYISGGTNYVFFTKPWVKRCTVDGNLLLCEDLTEVPKSAAGGAPPAQGGASPASTTPAPTAAPAAPASSTK